MKSSEEILFDLCKGQVVLVTGGNRGLGLELYRMLSTVDMNVYSLERRNDDLFEGNGGRIRCDISRVDHVARAVDKIMELHQKISVLINSAAIFENSDLVSSEFIPHIYNNIEVNLIGSINMVQKVLPYMIKNNYGIIINIGSSWADNDNPSKGGWGYKISKAALESFSNTLSSEYAKKGIKCYTYKPNKMATRMTNFHGEPPFNCAIEILDLIVRSKNIKRCNGVRL